MGFSDLVTLDTPLKVFRWTLLVRLVQLALGLAAVGLVGQTWPQMWKSDDLWSLHLLFWPELIGVFHVAIQSTVLTFFVPVTSPGVHLVASLFDLLLALFETVDIYIMAVLLTPKAPFSSEVFRERGLLNNDSYGVSVALTAFHTVLLMLFVSSFGLAQTIYSSFRDPDFPVVKESSAPIACLRKLARRMGVRIGVLDE